MALNVGELVASLRLEGVGKLGQDLDGVKAKLSAADKAFNGLKSVGQSVFSGVATAAGLGTLAVAGTTMALFNQGVAYNQLQQTSRAALKTLLGGAEAASAQMDKLDDFARNSPFSKSTFIQAQQQLIGFGFEAEKVIPTLEAVQNAVAAVGGSNQQISDITSILAKVQSSAKFTGEDLVQLGDRGLDAATLIGDGMGKTAAEIRESITDGTLDANTALTTLVDQMGTKYAGAASNVKETFAGTVDRVRAASRDIGALLAAPFVDPKGGGLAVTWGNQVADVLRAVQKETGPLVDFAVLKLNPAFESISARLTEAKFAVNGFSVSDVEAGLGLIAGHAPGFAALAGAVVASNVALFKQIPILGSLIPAINPLAGALIGAAAASPELREAIMGILEAMKPLLPVTTQVAELMAGSLTAGGQAAARVLEVATPIVSALADGVADLPAPIIAAGVALVGLKLIMGTSMWATMVKGTQGAVGGLQAFAQQSAIVQRAAVANGVQMTTMGAVATAAGRTVGAAAKSMALAFVGNPVGLALTAIAIGVGVWAQANADAEAKVAQHKERVGQLRAELNETTGMLTQAGVSSLTSSLIDEGTAGRLAETGVALSEFVQAAQGVPGITERVEGRLAEMGVTAARSGLDFGKVESASKTLGVSLEDMVLAAHGNADALELVQGAQQGTSLSATELARTLTYLESTTGVNGDMLDELMAEQAALDGARQATEMHNNAMQELRASGGEAAVQQRAFSDALDVVRDSAADTESRLQALNKALDILNGGTMNAEQQAIALQEGINSLADAFAPGENGIAGFSTDLVDATGKVQLATDAGLALAKSFTAVGDDAKLAAISAHDAAVAAGEDTAEQYAAAVDAMQPYIDSFRTQAEQAGLNKDQVDQLIESYFGLPSEVAIALDPEGSITTATSNLDSFIMLLAATPTGHPVDVSVLDDQAIADLAALGVTITTLPGGVVTATAETQAAEDALNYAARARTSSITQYITESRTSAPGPQKDGYVFPEANGGFFSGGVQQFADGGLRGITPLPAGVVKPGIYPGGANIIHFAEPETQWEAYISGKAGYKQRNQRVLAAAAGRLDMEVVPRSRAQQAVTAFAEGGMRGGGAPSSVASASSGYGTGIGSLTIQQEFKTVPNDSAEKIKRDAARSVVSAIRKAGRR